MGAKEEINTAAATAAEVSSSALLADANSDDDCTAAPATTTTTTATHIAVVASPSSSSAAPPPAVPAATTTTAVSSPCNNANDNPTPVPEPQESQQQQQQQSQKEGEKEPLQQQQQVPEVQPPQATVYLPQASPPPQVIIIPATQASTLATNAAKKIRRAFSMPRNPFRWSRKFKTSAAASASGTLDGDSVGGGSHNAMTACVGGGGRGRTGSIVSLSSYEAVSKDTNGAAAPAAATTTVVEAEVKKSAKKVANGRVATAGGDNNAPSAPGAGNGNRVFRRSSIRKFLNRIAQHVSSSVNGGAAAGKHGSPHTAYGPSSSAVDRVPPIGGYQWPADQTPGVMGLKNHGNTCFMNAVLQCLSHTDILAEYFVLDQYKADLKRRNKINSRKFGTKGELTEQLANVLKALWTCKNETDHGTSFKAVVDRYGSQFRSSTQHDAQEFLFWLLDKVHEDLNTATKRRYKSVKNNYGRSDEIIAAETLANHIRCNNSFVQAVFQAQFRSSLTCPRCKKQSNTFDPFHCISVQLPQLTQQTIFVTVVYMKPRQPRQVRMGVVVPAGSPIVALREQLQKDTSIPSHRMVLVDLNKEGFSRVFYDSQPVETLKGIDSIYCLEVEEVKAKQAEKSAVETCSTEANKAGASSGETGKRVATEASKTSPPPSPSTLLVLVACARKSLKKEENKSEEDSKEKIEKVSPASKDEKAAKDEKTSKDEKVSKDEKASKDVTGAKDEKSSELDRFGVPFSLEVPRDCSYSDLQKRLLRELAETLKPETFSYSKPLKDMFHIRLQDPSADPDAYLEQVEHPLLTEMIDLALSVLSSEAGPAHIKLLLEWSDPEEYFSNLNDEVVEDESVSRLMANKASDSATLTLEQCLEHYTKAETLSAEDAWRCPHCQQYLPVVKTLGLWSLPDILVVHFKRFRQHQEKGGNAAKLTTMVKFPLNAFDMSPHLARGEEGDIKASLASAVDSVAAYQLYRPGASWKKGSSGNSRSSTLNSRDNRETRYDLYAVCYHQGDTLETGHYTAACKNPYDRQWYKFDDQRVSKVPHAAIEEEIINNEAYMLFYQRRMGGEGSECSGSSSNSGDHWVSRIPPPAVNAGTLKVDKEKKAEAVAKEVSSADEEKVSEPKQAETKPIEIPKEAETLKDSEETLAPKVVTKDADPLDAEGIVFADESPMDEERLAEDPDELEVLEKMAASGAEVVELDDDQHIFHMDEDVELSLNEKPADSKDEGDSKKAKTPPPLSPKKVEKVAASVAPSASFTSPAKEKATSAPMDIKSSPSKASSLSSAASSSPESSGSGSPESFEAASHDTAARLPSSRLNGYAAAHSSSVGCRKDTASPMLSSSLKSTSSSIIGAAAMHDFKLARQQQYHWNGSRSSVSAVENAVGAAGGHHGGTCLSLRHSFSMSSNTCSKDTLIFIDQQSHHHHHRHHHHHSLIEDEDDDSSFMGSRSLWISPVTPHKLITVSPKN